MSKPYQPKTGQPCHCKPGIQRDNCGACEGTGQQIDFKAIREANMAYRKQLPPLKTIEAWVHKEQAGRI